MKKIAVIGRGTAGALAAARFSSLSDNCYVDWYYDPSIKTQAVGEGSTPVLPARLFNDIGFQHNNLSNIDGTFKFGIEKEGWGRGDLFYHNFYGATIGYHFNAIQLQNYIFNYLKNKKNVRFIEQNIINHNLIDSDFIMDCSGTPSSFEDCNISQYIPVNSVYVTQCYWSQPEFLHTKTIAKKHGWVFGIPLINRCSIGYLYNNDHTTKEEVKEDVQEIFKRYNLNPSDQTNNFSFNNYYRKKNYTDRISYNGNASFFLEPLEATSILTMYKVIEHSIEIWFNRKNYNTYNAIYNHLMYTLEVFIMMHYAAGSKYYSSFWDYALNRGINNLKDACENNLFKYNKVFNILIRLSEIQDQDILKNELNKIEYNRDLFNFERHTSYSVYSLYHNIIGLNLKDKLKEITSSRR